MRDSQLTELGGRHLLIAQLVAGGLKWPFLYGTVEWT